MFEGEGDLWQYFTLVPYWVLSMVYSIWDSRVQLGNDWCYKGRDLAWKGVTGRKKYLGLIPLTIFLDSVERKK